MGQKEALKMADFIHKSPSPFHVIKNCKDILNKEGFKEITPNTDWVIEKNHSYFTTVNSSMIVAFAIGGKYTPGNTITIVGTHTDSPCLRLKPRLDMIKNSHHMLSIQPYGGGLWHTWLDRPLIGGGRVFIKKDSHTIEEKLIKFDNPIACIPHLAIHLEHSYHKKFEINYESQFAPLLATESVSSLFEQNTDTTTKSDSSSNKRKNILIDKIAQMVECKIEDILNVEICLADAQSPCIYGVYEEFLSSPRLDNLFNTYTGLIGFIESFHSSKLEDDNSIRMIVCFDNEEVGSNSLQGAQSSFLEHTIKRILKSLSHDKIDELFEKTMSNSLLISADQAHGLHPNYPEKYETNHQPMLHNGCVIKYNAQMKYATSGLTSSIIKTIADIVNVPIQEFVVRNDSTCGSTIGPHLSSKLGISTVDIGFPMLAMHSIRETCCVSSVCQAISLFKGIFNHTPEILKNIHAL